MRGPNDHPVGTRLPPMPPAAVAAHLEELSPVARGRAQTALAAGRPVVLEGEVRARLRAARALAAVAFPGVPVVAVAGRAPRIDRVPAGHVLYVDDVVALTAASVLALAALLDDHMVPVIAGTSGPLPAPLAAELGGIVVVCGGAVAPPVLPAPEPPPPVTPPAAEREHLELVLTELAHELRNPLVTVKTFAEHLPDLLEDAALRGRFAVLAGEAIERMDALLENVMAFARLEPPVLQPLDLGALLDGLLAELKPELEARGIVVRRSGDTVIHCAGDREHLSYGLRNLFAGLAREVPPHDALLVDTQANGVVRLQFAPGAGEGARLRRLVGGEPDGRLGDPTVLPLAFTLARAALARGGGSLDVRTEPDGPTTLLVRLPAAGRQAA